MGNRLLIGDIGCRIERAFNGGEREGKEQKRLKKLAENKRNKREDGDKRWEKERKTGDVLVRESPWTVRMSGDGQDRSMTSAAN